VTVREDTKRFGRSRLPPLGSVLEFMRTIWALDHELQRTSRRMKSGLGVTGPQRLVLRVVGRFPGMSAGQLAQVLHLHPSTLTGVLQRLEHQGLLARRADARDGRRVLLGLTREGRQLDVDSEGTVEAAVRLALSEVSEQKVSSAVEVLGRIAASLERLGWVPGPSDSDTRRKRGP
jgi:MarR family transcriptional regulator, organic hydroperoxide resistance regulator